MISRVSLALMKKISPIASTQTSPAALRHQRDEGGRRFRHKDQRDRGKKRSLSLVLSKEVGSELKGEIEEEKPKLVEKDHFDPPPTAIGETLSEEQILTQQTLEQAPHGSTPEETPPHLRPVPENTSAPAPVTGSMDSISAEMIALMRAVKMTNDQVRASGGIKRYREAPKKQKQSVGLQNGSMINYKIE